MDLICKGPEKPYIVGGYFTLDSEHWTEDLTVPLRYFGAPFHLFAVGKLSDSCARLKPALIHQGMLAYPEKVLIWIDVDCIVKGSLDPLARLQGDVAASLRLSPERWRNRRRLNVRSGTMVFKPTRGAHRFIEAWCRYEEHSARFDDDQDSLPTTLGIATGYTFEPLDLIWCATDEYPHPEAVIVRTSAGHSQWRPSNLSESS